MYDLISVLRAAFLKFDNTVEYQLSGNLTSFSNGWYLVKK